MILTQRTLILLTFVIPSVFLFYSSVYSNDGSTIKFNFGEAAKSSYVNINSSLMFNDTLGYGFDYGTKVSFTANKIKSGTEEQAATSDSPFYFSVKVPEGHYAVSVTLGGIPAKSITTVKAESRRLMLENIITEANETRKLTFTVNVRTPKINDSTSIRLKKREHGYLNWDNKLTLEFLGESPAVCAIEVKAIKPETTIYLAGNSTVTDQNNEPWASWGQMFTRFVKPGISVANYAESGESLHSFYHAKRLEKVLSLIQPGDYLLIEFAHNDQKRKGEGIGPWKSYTDYLRMYIDKTREKGAVPVLITSMHRRNFDKSGRVINTLGDYPEAMRVIAKEKDIYLIDLNKMSKTLYESWGVEGSKNGFVHYPPRTFPNQEAALKDNTHFNNYGAYHIAMCILWHIRENNLPLKALLIDGVEYYSPDRPVPFEEWHFPHSGMASNAKPEGD